ncbi:MAG: hypothetical protein KDA71_24345, partial [Planctomycetales bacterium]|nr:hypothetical protein [Planctomycetales bacterium]
MTQNKLPLVTFDPSGCFVSGTKLERAAFDQLAPRLEAARRETLDVDMRLLDDPASIPAEKQPLDARFIDMPERILSEYRQSRDSSELGRILATANRLRDQVDRVVVLGIGGSYM